MVRLTVLFIFMRSPCDRIKIPKVADKKKKKKKSAIFLLFMC